MDGSEGFIIGDGKNRRSPENTQEMSSLLNAAYFRARIWPNVKPFVNGFLTGQISWLQSSCVQMLLKHLQEKDLVVKELSPDLHERLRGRLNSHLKRVPVTFLHQAAYTTAQFGTFDFLRKWIKDRNGGIPLALHQEACCGMISGGIAGCISYPLTLALASVNPNSNLRSLLNPLYLQARKEGFLALWKGSGHHVTTQAFVNLGLLTSYSRSLSFFQTSVGLSNAESQIGAGIVSAFCAAACSSTLAHINVIDELIHKHYGNLNYSTRLRMLVDLMGFVLKPGGEVMFYSKVLRRAIQLTPIVVIAWLNLESIKKFEESRGY